MFKERSGRSPKTPALEKLFRFGVDLAKGLRQTTLFGALDFRAQPVQTIELGIKLSFFRRRRVSEASFGVAGRQEPSLLRGWSVWLSQRPAPSRGDVFGRTVFPELQSELNGVRCHHDGSPMKMWSALLVAGQSIFKLSQPKKCPQTSGQGHA